MGKVHRSAITGRFVSPGTVQRHPDRTVTQTSGSKATGHRSAVSGRFVKESTANRHPDKTIKEGG